MWNSLLWHTRPQNVWPCALQPLLLYILYAFGILVTLSLVGGREIIVELSDPYYQTIVELNLSSQKAL